MLANENDRCFICGSFFFGFFFAIEAVLYWIICAIEAGLYWTVFAAMAGWRNPPLRKASPERMAPGPMLAAANRWGPGRQRLSGGSPVSVPMPGFGFSYLGGGLVCSCSFSAVTYAIELGSPR